MPSESERIQETQRGYNADGVWYHSMPEHADQGEINERVVVRELEQALTAAHELLSVLLECQSLVYVVKVSSVVRDDVLELCHGCREATEASISTRDYLSGRARAAARQAARASAKVGLGS